MKQWLLNRVVIKASAGLGLSFSFWALWCAPGALVALVPGVWTRPRRLAPQDLPVACASRGSRQSILIRASFLRLSHGVQERPGFRARTLFPCARPYRCS